MTARNGHDPLVVSVPDFLEILQPLIDQQRKLYEHGASSENTTHYGQLRDEFLSPVSYIARTVGVDESGVRRLFQGDQKFITLSRVDEWLTKLNLGHRLRDLRIVPNPQLTPEKWRARFLRDGDEIPDDVDFSAWPDYCG